MSEEEWSQTESRLHEVKKGKVKLVPARKVARRIETALKNRNA